MIGPGARRDVEAAAAALAEGEAGPHPAGVMALAGVVRATVPRIQIWGRKRPKVAREPARPGARRADHRLGFDFAALGRDARDGPPLGLDREHGAVLVEGGAQALGRAADGGRRLVGLGLAVARRIEAADGARPDAGDKVLDLLAVEGSRIELMLAGRLDPALELGHARLVVAQHQVAALDPFDVGLDLGLEAAPDAVALHHQRDLGRVAALLAHEAPVAARLLARHRALLAHHGGHAALGQVVRGRTPDDAATDDDDLGRFSHRTSPRVARLLQGSSSSPDTGGVSGTRSRMRWKAARSGALRHGGEQPLRAFRAPTPLGDGPRTKELV